MRIIENVDPAALKLLPNLIEQCNYHSKITFYGWFGRIAGPTDDTIAIFKVKWYAKRTNKGEKGGITL